MAYRWPGPVPVGLFFSLYSIAMLDQYAFFFKGVFGKISPRTGLCSKRYLFDNCEWLASCYEISMLRCIFIRIHEKRLVFVVELVPENRR